MWKTGVQEITNHRGNGIFPAEMKWKMFPAKIKYYPRNQIFPAEIKYSPRKWNVAIFPAAEKIFPAAKNIPRGPENIPRGNWYNNIPRGRENILRGKIYSPRPRKYSPRQNIFPAAEKIFPAAKNIPRGRENIPRGKKYSFLCPSQASVDTLVHRPELPHHAQNILWNITTSLCFFCCGYMLDHLPCRLISLTSHKTAVTPLLTHWSYCSLALSHGCDQFTDILGFLHRYWGNHSIAIMSVELPWRICIKSTVIKSQQITAKSENL